MLKIIYPQTYPHPVDNFSGDFSTVFLRDVENISVFLPTYDVNVKTTTFPRQISDKYTTFCYFLRINLSIESFPQAVDNSVDNTVRMVLGLKNSKNIFKRGRWKSPFIKYPDFPQTWRFAQ